MTKLPKYIYKDRKGRGSTALAELMADGARESNGVHGPQDAISRRWRDDQVKFTGTKRMQIA